MLDYDAVADADIVIEAVYENLDLKKEVFARLDATMKQGAVLASNTSALDLDQMAAATKRPGDVVGVHFFSPANIMQLLEVVRGAETGKETLATAMALGRAIGKIPVMSLNAPDSSATIRSAATLARRPRSSCTAHRPSRWTR